MVLELRAGAPVPCRVSFPEVSGLGLKKEAHQNQGTGKGIVERDLRATV